MLSEINTLAAHMMLGLHPELSAADKRVGIAIIEHFNRKDGRCNPSIARLSKLLDLPDKTVRRATAKLHSLKLILKVSHGGRSGTARYIPQWDVFASLKADWEAKFSSKPARTDRTKLTGTTGQECPKQPDKNVRQTQRTNPKKEPKPTNVEKRARPRIRQAQGHFLLPVDGGLSIRREQQASNQALKRVDAYLQRIAGAYEAFAMLPTQDQQSAYDAERHKSGEGCALALRLIQEQPHNQAIAVASR
ncbi:MAG: helix-turn-helix domain-containing protein [Pseudomonadota bacterium]